MGLVIVRDQPGALPGILVLQVLPDEDEELLEVGLVGALGRHEDDVVLQAVAYGSEQSGGPPVLVDDHVDGLHDRVYEAMVDPGLTLSEYPQALCFLLKVLKLYRMKDLEATSLTYLVSSM